MANGILIVDKPEGWTSQDVVSKLRGVLHEKQRAFSWFLHRPASFVFLPNIHLSAWRRIFGSILASCFVDVNKKPLSFLLILLNAGISKTNTIFLRQTLDIFRRGAYNALKQTAWVPPDPVHMET